MAKKNAQLIKARRFTLFNFSVLKYKAESEFSITAFLGIMSTTLARVRIDISALDQFFFYPFVAVAFHVVQAQ